MNPKFLMIASAVILAGLGLPASFAPREILMFLGARLGPLPVLLVQITGALYLGFALLNWRTGEVSSAVSTAARWPSAIPCTSRSWGLPC